MGISGPSSSGKTTIARLLRRIFPLSWGDDGDNSKDEVAGIETFLIHEDDFYFTDDKYGALLAEISCDPLLSSYELWDLRWE